MAASRRFFTPKDCGNVLAAWQGFLRLAGGCFKCRGDRRNPDFAIETRYKVAGPVRRGGFLCTIRSGVIFIIPNGKRQTVRDHVSSREALAHDHVGRKLMPCNPARMDLRISSIKPPRLSRFLTRPAAALLPSQSGNHSGLYEAFAGAAKCSGARSPTCLLYTSPSPRD